jgi:hypothetical protein
MCTKPALQKMLRGITHMEKGKTPSQTPEDMKE